MEKEFCVTTGRGMQSFVVEELKKLNIMKCNTVEGKIFFSTLLSKEYLHLKCAERIFAVAYFQMIQNEYINLKGLLDLLHSTVCNELLEKAVKIVIENGDEEGTRKFDGGFRVSIRCAGKWRRKINVHRLAADLARRICGRYGWQVNLRHPSFDICIHINENQIFIGIPLSRFPLSRRPYMLDNSLRSTVCNAMLSLANFAGSDIVLDLTCGSSSILIECVHILRNNVWIFSWTNSILIFFYSSLYLICCCAGLNK
ncbi:hypothetical protein AB6A40_005715 [Gnathostoma spinigerum]|uniref:THUMP domain-containing protein n=1 Tax=Gnathostoma spinigerum TaxID=75299 RepID=A0ABD6EID0_9BILA